ncbi:MAG: hypothetical protein ACFFBH_00080 [Promethearchaeota archaeon]
MSQLIDLIPNLKEIFTFINNINESIKDDKLKLEAEANEIFNAIEGFNKEKNSNLQKIKSNKDAIENLKAKIFQLNQEIPKNELELKDYSKKHMEVKVRLEPKEKELNEIRLDIENTISEFNKKKQIFKDIDLELSESWNLVEEKIQEISKLEEKFNHDINALKSEYNQIITKKEEDIRQKLKELDTIEQQRYNDHLYKINAEKQKIKAMYLLIKNRLIHTDLYNFIKSLEKNQPLDLKFLCQTLNFDVKKAESIVKNMIEKGGPVNFDPKNGVLTLQKEVEFNK